ncbi:type IV pilus modification protein PilV [Dyella sp. RRB7]|uniref:type IV pilus modification protein PilV n=1 Tax=Dyella sp. RRB7 TaxID=2919502 RepID=UPI001FAA056D|nr:type IV pilus modification protein PilV [Dyella sp. RRB7]
MILISRSTNRGFTLLEVLVALVVISVGLLGIAAMQASAITNTHASQMESLVAIEARSMADAMQANQAYWNTNAVANVAVSSSVISDSTLAGYASTYNCGAVACSPAQLAAYDLKAWGSQLSAQVPGATANIACAIASPSECTIKITWQPKTAVAISQGTQSTVPTTATNLTYTLVNQF